MPVTVASEQHSVDVVCQTLTTIHHSRSFRITDSDSATVDSSPINKEHILINLCKVYTRTLI